MLNKIYPILIFFCIGYAHSVCDSYRVIYSILSIDDELAFKLSKVDSLTQVITEEAKKLKDREICENKYCSEGCGRFIRFPQNLYSKLSQDKWLELWENTDSNDIYLVPADTLYEERCYSTNITIFIDPPLKIVDACSLRFFSEKSPNDEQIVLINETAYNIIKRKDGSNVLRRAK
jgi:hypothetical protein